MNRSIILTAAVVVLGLLVADTGSASVPPVARPDTRDAADCDPAPAELANPENGALAERIDDFCGG